MGLSQRDSIARENLRNTVSGTVTYGYSAKKCTSPHLPDSMNFFRDALCSLFFGSNVSRRTCGLLRNRELKFSETCTNSGIVVLWELYCRSIDAPVEFIQSDSLFKPGELPVRSIPSVGVNHNNVDAFRPFFAGLTRRIRIDDSQYHTFSQTIEEAVTFFSIFAITNVFPGLSMARRCASRAASASRWC